MIKVAINEEFEQIFGMISRAAFFGCLDDELKIVNMDTIHKHINDAHFVIAINNLVERLWEKQALFSVITLDKLHV